MHTLTQNDTHKSNTCTHIHTQTRTQVYAASIMFGYFLRRVDKRFQLEKSLGTLPIQRDEAVARLNQLFAQVGRKLNRFMCVSCAYGTLPIQRDGQRSQD